MISVVLYPPFSQKAGLKKVTVPFAEGMNVNTVLEILSEKDPVLNKYLKAADSKRYVLIAINGISVHGDTQLIAGDEVTLISAYGGG